jgi:hypothetical protein
MILLASARLPKMCLRLKPEYLLVLDYFVMNHRSVTLQWPQTGLPCASLIQANMNFILFIQGLLKNSIRPVCPDARLHMIIQRFCLLKFTKPADEHHLQALPTLLANLALYNMTVHNHLEYYCSQLGRLN